MRVTGQSRRFVAGMACVAGVTLALCATGVVAQDFGRRGRRFEAPTNERVPYDAKWAFVRLRHTVGAGAYGRGEPPWAHDYPTAERNFAPSSRKSRSSSRT